MSFCELSNVCSKDSESVWFIGFLVSKAIRLVLVRSDELTIAVISDFLHGLKAVAS